jgi:hypothetical protein
MQQIFCKLMSQYGVEIRQNAIGKVWQHFGIVFIENYF